MSPGVQAARSRWWEPEAWKDCRREGRRLDTLSLARVRRGEDDGTVTARAADERKTDREARKKSSLTSRKGRRNSVASVIEGHESHGTARSDLDAKCQAEARHLDDLEHIPLPRLPRGRYARRSDGAVPCPEEDVRTELKTSQRADDGAELRKDRRGGKGRRSRRCCSNVYHTNKPRTGPVAVRASTSVRVAESRTLASAAPDSIAAARREAAGSAPGHDSAGHVTLARPSASMSSVASCDSRNPTLLASITVPCWALAEAFDDGAAPAADAAAPGAS